jgi:hypothetical protein
MSERSEGLDQRDESGVLQRPRGARLLVTLALLVGLMAGSVVVGEALAGDVRPDTIIAPASSPSVTGDWIATTGSTSR